MLAILGIWTIIFIVSFSVGLLINACIEKYTSHRYKVVDSDMLVYNPLIGLCFLIALLSLVSIFFRINIEILGLLFVGSIATIWVNRSTIYQELELIFSRKNKLYLFGLVAFLPLGFLWYNSMENPASIGDTMLYHAQCIQWSEKYKAIPGLANLHNRLAFNNQSLLLFSLFGFTFTGIQTFYAVNSFLLLLLTVKCSADIARAYVQNNFGELLLALSLLIGSHFIFGERIASPAPDNTTAVLILFSAILFKEIYLDRKLNLLPHLYIISFALPTVKLSTVFNAILPVFLSIKEKLVFKKQHILTLVAYGLFAFGPFIARHIIMSGYLVFPFPLDLFSFDWKYEDIERLEMMNEVITNAARITGPHQKGLDTMNMSIVEWFPYWLTFRSKEYYLMNGMLPISLLFMAFSFVSFKVQQRKGNYFFTLFNVYFLLAFIFWLVKAPDYRFFWGTLVAGFSFFLFFLFLNFNTNNRLLYKVGVSFSLLVFLGLGINRFSSKKFRKHMIYPMTLKKIDVKQQDFQGIYINLPASKRLGGLCWNAPVPCTHSINRRLELRGKTITDGFRLNYKRLLKKKKGAKKKGVKKKKKKEKK